MKYGIITAKQLLYFKMAGAICSLCSLPHGQLYHFTRCVHGIIPKYYVPNVSAAVLPQRDNTLSNKLIFV